MVVHKVYFKIQCPFDSFGTLPPQESEISFLVDKDSQLVFGPPTVCDRCNGTNMNECGSCITALYLMFQQSRILLDFDLDHLVHQISQPIRPSLELLSERSQPAGQ